MSINYDVSQNGLRIETFPKGVLETKGTIDYFAKLKNDTRIQKGAVEVVNFKDVTDYQVSYLECEAIAESYQEPKDIKMIYSTVFVCETDLSYGIGRMLNALHEIINPNHKVGVVRSESDVEDAIKNL